MRNFPWFLHGTDRLAENFPLIVDHLLIPAEFRKRVLLELMVARNGVSSGYRILSDFVMRGLVRTILTTNFDTCLPDALKERQPHIRQVHEVNRSPGDDAEFDVFSKCQIVWLHGRAEQYSDKNSVGEVDTIDQKLISLLRPLVVSSPIIVVGYRGAEPSVMEGLFGQNKEGRLDFPHGVYWCSRRGETPHPSVENLRRRLGSNFRLLEIEGFDELFADLARELTGQDRYSGAGASVSVAGHSQAFDERTVASASLDDLDLDLALQVLRQYCEKLGRATVTRETLLVLMREQGLLIHDKEKDLDKVTAGAILLFGKLPQDFLPHAVVSVTEAGRKREIYEGNLISQHRKLLEKLETPEVNPRLKVKKRRQHDERPAYPPRVLVELLVNMLVHRDYEIAEPARIEIHPGAEVVFGNPGCLTQRLAGRVTVEDDGRFTLSESLTDLRNPSLCDIFFGMSAMERAGTGLIDVGELMLAGGGASAFYSKESRFEARITQPQASAGSQAIARSLVPTGLYVLNSLPFTVLPENVSIVRLTVPLRARPPGLDLSECGTFVNRENELWSFVPLPILTDHLASIVDLKTSKTMSRAKVESSSDSKRVLSWLLRKHWERYLVTFVDDGLILEDGRKHRAYFEGRNKQGRTIIWDGPQRRGNRREVVKKRSDTIPVWFENEGFGYEVVDICGTWCIRIKPFYMFTGRDARTPLPSFARAAKATRRIKFDRNKSVEADLVFWSSFLGRGGETINAGQAHVDDVLIDASFLTVEVPEIGLINDESGHQNRMPA